METEGKRILVNYLTDIADTFRSITGETDLIDARTYPTEIEKVAGGSSSKNSYQRGSIEEMNAITDASDGDRCLILKETESNIVKDKKSKTIKFSITSCNGIAYRTILYSCFGNRRRNLW